MKPKREPKKGDRCEHAAREGDSIRLHRDCTVRHLEGSPPGMLAPRIVNDKTALLCTRHCRLYEAPNVRKQKPRKADAEQVDLVEAAGLADLVTPPCVGHERGLDAAPLRAFGIAPLFAMPEGI